jgi:hypothetical protein
MHGLDKALQHSIRGELEESEKILRSLDQKDLRVKYNLGWHNLRHGKFLKGMEGLQQGRWAEAFGSPPIPGKLWKNETLIGRTLLFRMEGGLGDHILNFRFAEEFQKKGARVVIVTDKSLVSLFSRHGYVCITEEAISFTHYDYWVPAMAVPFMLLLNNPHHSDYLISCPKLKRHRSRPRIGVRWGGNTSNTVEQYRALPAEKIIALHETIDADFYSFQRDDNLHTVPFTDLRDELETWEDTLSWLCSMDLLITSCTSVAHAAAAMGIKTWIIIPCLSYYTWAVPGPHTSWYSSVKLYRQTDIENFDKPIEELTHDLQALFA